MSTHLRVFVLLSGLIGVLLIGLEFWRPRRKLLGCLHAFWKPKLAVARLAGMLWTRHDFNQHWLITGATGSGKTRSAIFHLLLELFRNQPRFGGLCVDIKGVLHEPISSMASHFGRQSDLIILQVRKETDPADWRPPHRINLVGDRRIHPSTLARCLVDTAVAMGNRREQTFFRRSAQVSIGMALEALIALDFEVTLENVHDVLVNPEDTADLLKHLGANPQHQTLAAHFKNYLAQPPEQLSGVTGTISNYIHYFTKPAIAEVFCKDSTFSLRDMDAGKIICLSLPQEFQTERRFVGTFLKLMTYTQALSRFDAAADIRKNHNLLVVLQDECQQFVTNSEDGLNDSAVVDLVREANVSVIAATQSTTSLVPVLGAEAAKVFCLNLRNRIIFTAADEEDAGASAAFIGKRMKRERSETRNRGRSSYTYTEKENFKVRPFELRKLRKHQAVIVHADGRHRKRTLPPLEPDGTVSKWYRRFWFA